MRLRRDGQGETSAPTLAPIDVSTRVVAPPARLGAIRGAAELQRDLEVAQWWEVWR